ncbi:hypothetical protein SAMN05421797_1011462 [Maribacter ulvicola]|uniref:Uncharacterized protein n=1 Tax=Maribacter ulvicola TaxID=228959 RepID=A0A1N6S0E1_9FLAO|nr:hypothetical protein SAMN05421797_1011462 [Maribacter ulvicola]
MIKTGLIEQVEVLGLHLGTVIVLQENTIAVLEPIVLVRQNQAAGFQFQELPHTEIPEAALEAILQAEAQAAQAPGLTVAPETVLGVATTAQEEGVLVVALIKAQEAALEVLAAGLQLDLPVHQEVAVVEETKIIHLSKLKH